MSENRDPVKTAKISGNLDKTSPISYQGPLANFGFESSVSKRQIDTLKEMHWLKDAFYNLVFLGPLGIGKIYFAVGLEIEAVQ